MTFSEAQVRTLIKRAAEMVDIMGYTMDAMLTGSRTDHNRAVGSRKEMAEAILLKEFLGEKPVIIRKGERECALAGSQYA